MDKANPKSVGLGCVNGRYFLFHAGMGFDAAVVAEVEKRGRLKRYASHAYLFMRLSIHGYGITIASDQPSGSNTVMGQSYLVLSLQFVSTLTLTHTLVANLEVIF